MAIYRGKWGFRPWDGMGWAFWENSKWNSDMEDMAEKTKPSEVRKLQTGGCICDFSYWAAKQPSTQPTPRDSKNAYGFSSGFSHSSHSSTWSGYLVQTGWRAEDVFWSHSLSQDIAKQRSCFSVYNVYVCIYSPRLNHFAWHKSCSPCVSESVSTL